MREPPDWLKLKFWMELHPLIVKRAETKVVIITGNHDSNLQNHAFESAGFLTSALASSVSIFSRPYLWKFFQDRAHIMFMPYCKQEDLSEAIDSAIKEMDRVDLATDKKLPRFFFGHNEITGAVMGPAQIKIKAQVEPEDLVGFDATVLGHIHKAQGGDYQGGAWCYIGSPVYQDFGEVDDPPKGFAHLCHSKEAGWEVLAVPTNPIPLAEIEITEEDTDEFLEKELDHIPTCAVKIKFKGTESWLKSKQASDWRDLFQEMERKGRFLKVVFDTLCTDRQIDEAEGASQSIEDEMKHFCEERGKESLLNIGLELLQEARDED